MSIFKTIAVIFGGSDFENNREKEIKKFALEILSEKNEKINDNNAKKIIYDLCKDLMKNDISRYNKLTKTYFCTQISLESFSDKVYKEVVKELDNNFRFNIATNNSNNIKKSYEQYKKDYFYTKIVGVTIGSRQEHIKKILEGSKLRLCREKYNKYDRNAIAVYSGINHIGYLSKKVASSLATNMDKYGSDYYCCIVEKITGGNEYNLGVNVKIICNYDTENFINSQIEDYSMIKKSSYNYDEDGSFCLDNEGVAGL